MTVPSYKRNRKMAFRSCEEFSPVPQSIPEDTVGSKLCVCGPSGSVLGYMGQVTSETLYRWLTRSCPLEGCPHKQSSPQSSLVLLISVTLHPVN